MEIETLKRSNLKRNIIIGVVVVAIIVAVVITFSRASYKSVAKVDLVNGEVHYTLADLNIVAITVDGASVDTLPEGNYNLLETSYCEVDGEKENVTLSWDSNTKALSVTPFTKRGTKCYLDFEEVVSAGDTILGNIEVNEGDPTLTGTSCATGTNNSGNCDVSENGLYEGEDDYGTTYYFRGTVDNNWVKFAGYYWRIIRINGDGTIRLIYSGEATEDTVQESNITGNETQLESSSAFNSSYNASYYVGYMYSNSQHGNGTSSTIKGVLDSWYQTNLSSYSSYIADSGFCGDREMASGYEWSATPSSTIYYAAYDRWSGTPTFKCSNSADLYTVSNSKGNQALEYPIGLITMDEVRYAGAYSSTSNYGYWLYTGQYYWTMSPYYFRSTGYALVFFVFSTGFLYYNSVYYTYGVRPVINLKAETQFTGEGTITSPFEVI